MASVWKTLLATEFEVRDVSVRSITSLQSVVWGFNDLFFYIKLEIASVRADVTKADPYDLARKADLGLELTQLFNHLMDRILFDGGDAATASANALLIRLGISSKRAPEISDHCYQRIADEILKTIPHISTVPKNDIQASFTEMGELTLVFWNEPDYE